MKTLVSQCLAGFSCRYDSKCSADPDVMELVGRGEAICICPEVMGGMPTPRLPGEIQGGDGADVLGGAARVVNSAGEDVTDFFLRGAVLALKACREHGVERAILKARSPSCGCGMIYDGSFSGKLRQGDGVTAALLRQSGIKVESR